MDMDGWMRMQEIIGMPEGGDYSCACCERGRMPHVARVVGVAARPGIGLDAAMEVAARMVETATRAGGR